MSVVTCKRHLTPYPQRPVKRRRSGPDFGKPRHQQHSNRDLAQRGHWERCRDGEEWASGDMGKWGVYTEKEKGPTGGTCCPFTGEVRLSPFQHISAEKIPPFSSG